MIWRLVELALVVWFVNSWLARRFAPPAPPGRPGGAPPDPAAPRSPGPLVRCAGCGVHVPVSRAAGFAADGRVYCSERCRVPAGG
ncbi:MAG TPA: PP0621 family protein [Thermoanaerobaculia bacterium]|nr:PP0621 family protein [Thermoanaerobaculia bacterium]